jgi:serine/threonine protein phosphatase PrpC
MPMNCSACGAPADPEARFCEECGARIDGAVVDTNTRASAPPDRREFNLGRELAAVSDRGLVHVQNEDAVVVLSASMSAILVVCDGVSISHDPALGSGTAADATAQSLLQGVMAGKDPKELMRTAILAGHEAICGLMPAGTSSEDRPLTTIVAALAGAGKATIGWAGDSRAYLLAGPGKLLTRDDSWVNWVVARGEMTEAQAMHSPNAHAIVQCLGDPDDPPEPHIVTTALSPGEKLLLCSDGMWNYAPTPSALMALTAPFPAATPAITLCQALVEFANGSGGRDNITAAILIVSDHVSGT